MTRLSCPLPCCGFARCRPFSIFRPSGIMCLKSHPLCVCVCACVPCWCLMFVPRQSHCFHRSLALSLSHVFLSGCWKCSTRSTMEILSTFSSSQTLKNGHGRFSARGGSHGRASWWTPPLLLPRLNPGGAGRLLTRNS